MKKLLITSALIVGISGAAAFAINQSQIGAEDVPEIQLQVNEHEERIDSLEGRQTNTEAQVSQQGSDIQAIQQVTGVASTTPSSPSAPAPQGSPAPAPNVQPASDPVPSPAPEPEPATNPRLITAVSESVSGGFRTCDYTLHNALHDLRQGVILQPESRPCLEPGDILPVS